MNTNEVSINVINLFIIGKDDGTVLKIYDGSVSYTLSCCTLDSDMVCLKIYFDFLLFKDMLRGIQGVHFLSAAKTRIFRGSPFKMRK